MLRSLFRDQGPLHHAGNAPSRYTTFLGSPCPETPAQGVVETGGRPSPAQDNAPASALPLGARGLRQEGAGGRGAGGESRLESRERPAPPKAQPCPGEPAGGKGLMLPKRRLPDSPEPLGRKRVSSLWRTGTRSRCRDPRPRQHVLGVYALAPPGPLTSTRPGAA